MRLKAKTTMKINFLVKMIMIVLFVLGAFVFFVDISKAAESEWKNNPAECSTKLGAVECSSGYRICGVFNNSGLCFTPMTRERLSSTNDGLSQTRYSPSFGGGFILDCNATVTQTKGETEPHCNNSNTIGVNSLWCNASTTCSNDHVLTRCFAGIWEGQSGSHECVVPGMTPTTTGCVSGYANCNLGEPNSPIDPSDCEVRIGFTTCTGAGGLQGTYNASCQCVVATSTFVTGVQTHFATSSPLLWGTQYGDGDLIKFSKNNISTNTFMVKNDGSVGIGTDSFDSNVAALVVSSTSKGILIPRLTVSQRDAISGAPEGLLLYNMDDHEFNYYNGSGWESVGKTYSASSTGGLNLSGTSFSANVDNLTIEISGSNQLKVKYDPIFFATNTTGLTFMYDDGFFATSSFGLMLKDMGVVSSTYGSENTAVTLGIDNYGRVYFVATSAIMIGIENITNSSSLARVDMENTFTSPTIFSASTTFNATTTHNAGVRANLYCDSSGTNCFDPSLGWVTTVLDVTTTPATTTGSFTFTTGTLRGYQAGNAICNHYYPGYHFCFSGEIISYIRTASNINKFAGLPQAWISEGPPGFTSDSNDCGGYTTADLEPLGAFWEFDSDGGGRGWLSTCGSAKNIACCK